LNEGNKVMTNETLNLPNVDQSQRESNQSSCSTYEEVNNMKESADNLHGSFPNVSKSSVLNQVVDEQTSSRLKQRDSTSSLSMNIDNKVSISNNRLNSDQLKNNVSDEGIYE